MSKPTSVFESKIKQKKKDKVVHGTSEPFEALNSEDAPPKPATRYFLKGNPTLPVVSDDGETAVGFMIVQTPSTSLEGVAATSDPKEQALLENYPGVEEISKELYESYTAKKKPPHEWQYHFHADSRTTLASQTARPTPPKGEVAAEKAADTETRKIPPTIITGELS